MEKPRTIRLYGKLGQKFGRIHKFVCNNTAEAVRALCSMVPGFQKELIESQKRGVGYACFIGKDNIGKDELHLNASDKDIKIAPMLQGSGGNGGVFQIIVGVIMIAAAFFTGGASIAAWSASATMMGAMGAAMVLSGISMMMTKTQIGVTGVDSPDNGASYNFNGPVNVTAQGNPVPVFYGEMIVGSVTISGDMYAEDQQ